MWSLHPEGWNCRRGWWLQPLINLLCCPYKILLDSLLETFSVIGNEILQESAGPAQSDELWVGDMVIGHSHKSLIFYPHVGGILDTIVLDTTQMMNMIEGGRMVNISVARQSLLMKQKAYQQESLTMCGFTLHVSSTCSKLYATSDLIPESMWQLNNQKRSAKIVQGSAVGIIFIVFYILCSVSELQKQWCAHYWGIQSKFQSQIVS